ncbi:MAG TPA: hypothetical protein VGS58_13600, partial [Candidatus Sulfopaludibacter sp.]|nr:hypothetical protein [Candidatus Sulfopaludibacter sp.]
MLKRPFAVTLVCLAIAAAGCGGKLQQQASPAASAIDSNRYYAVLLSNGSVYFGRLEGLGSPFPVLHDVYYVQSTQNPDTKAVSSVLVKRGKEWHAPDRMTISEKSIVFCGTCRAGFQGRPVDCRI